MGEICGINCAAKTRPLKDSSVKDSARHVARAISLATFTLLGLASAHTHAQAYAVEMVIFANTAEDALTVETWRADPGLPDVSRALAISAAGDGDVSAINSNAYRLSGIWQVLRNSSQYRPLRHLAWTQHGRSRASAPEVLIGESPSSDVYGTVRMSRTRFLHLDIDLLLHKGNASFRFINHRRMRSNELNYIDHPLFGVLVIATPLQ